MALIPSLLLLVLSCSAAAAAASICFTPTISGDITLHHINSNCYRVHSQITPFDNVLQLSGRADSSRLSFLASLTASSVPIASGEHIVDTAIYLLRASLGSPPQPVLLAFDSSSDASFLSVPNFSSSPSFQPLPCSSALCLPFKPQPCSSPSSLCTYNQSYGGYSSFSAVVAQDSLHLASDVIPSFTFGAVTYTAAAGGFFPKQGLLGLGRGPASLLSQTTSLYHSTFSYCLPGFNSYYYSGSLRLGRRNQPPRIRTTPLLLNPHRPSLYYVNLTSVSVGRVNVAVPSDSLAFDPQTGAGTIVDAGTVITRFVAQAYIAIRDEFRKQVNAPNGYESLGAFDTCYTTAGVGAVEASPPTLTLHLEGLDLPLPMENSMIHSSGRPLACLALAAAPANVNAVVNVIASYQQQNHRVLIDVPGSRVGFARELCS